jgi:hypothetical protein
MGNAHCLWVSHQTFLEDPKILDAVLLPQLVAVIHCPGHQKTDDLIVLGNKKADAEKEATQKPYIKGPLLWEESLLPPERPHYLTLEAQMAPSQGYHLDHQRWWFSPEDKLLLPQSLHWKVLKTLHQTYHLGVENTLSLIKCMSEGVKISETLQDIIKGCEICQRNNPCNLPLTPAGLKGKAPIPERTGKLISPTCQ